MWEGVNNHDAADAAATADDDDDDDDDKLKKTIKVNLDRLDWWLKKGNQRVIPWWYSSHF